MVSPRITTRYAAPRVSLGYETAHSGFSPALPWRILRRCVCHLYQERVRTSWLVFLPSRVHAALLTGPPRPSTPSVSIGAARLPPTTAATRIPASMDGMSWSAATALRRRRAISPFTLTSTRNVIKYTVPAGPALPLYCTMYELCSEVNREATFLCHSPMVSHRHHVSGHTADAQPQRAVFGAVRYHRRIIGTWQYLHVLGSEV